MINFKNINIITSLIAFSLFLALLLFPQIMFYLFQITENESAFFMARRSSILFLALGVLAWLTRNIDSNESKKAICLSYITMMFGLVVLGVVEYFRDKTGIGISLAIVTEFLLGSAYIRVYYLNRHAV